MGIVELHKKNWVLAKNARAAFFSSILTLVSTTSAAAESIAIQGRLLNADGSAVTSSAVQFTIKVKSPGVENCLLYQEMQTLNLSQTAGAFALTLGSGTRVAATVDGGNPLNTVFSNSGTISLTSAPAACANSATSFTPATADTRNLEITFDDGSGVDSIPTIPLAWTPQSIYSQDAGKLAGVNATQYLKVTSGTTPATLSAVDYSNLAALLNGSSTQYMSSSTTNGTVVPNLVTAPATPSAGQMWFDSLSNTMKYYNGTAIQTIGTSTGLSSVGLTMPAIFSVSGSPLTSNGSIATTLANQSANTVFAGPSSGGAAAPTFRAIAAADLPTGVPGGIIKDGGNSLGAAITLGTNDANTLGLKTNNSTRMTIDSSGNVGIGTTTTTYPLTVGGSAELDGNGSDVFLSLKKSALVDFRLVSQIGTTNQFVIRNQQNGALPLIINTSAPSNSLVLSNGNVGVGTTSPRSILDVVGSNGIWNRNSTGGSIVFDDTDVADSSTPISSIFGIDGTLRFMRGNRNPANGLSTGSVESMRITSAGNIGIGTTSPTTPLDISSDSATPVRIYRNNSNVSYQVTNNVGSVFFGTNVSGNVAIGHSNAQALAPFQITSAGNVGIGTAGPTEKLHLNGNIVTEGTTPRIWWNSAKTYGVGFNNSTRLQFLTNGSTGAELQTVGTANAKFNVSQYSSGASAAGYPAFGFISDADTGMFLHGSEVLGFSTNGTSRLVIDSTGNVGIGTTNPTEKLTVTGTGLFSDTLTVGGGVRSTGSSVVYFENIALKNNSSIPNGFIKLVTPIRTSHNQMFSIDITGYDYNTGKTIDFTVAGYAYGASGTVLNLGYSNRSNFSREVRVALEDRGDGRVLVIALGTSDGDGNSNEAWYFQKFGATVRLWSGAATTYTANQFTWVNGETTLAAGHWKTANINKQQFDGEAGTIYSANNAFLAATGGNVGIGTTGPNYKLDVAGDINTSTCFRLSSGTTVGGTCTSDERLKEDVQDYTAGLSDLLKIKLHTYRFNGLGEMPKTHESAVGVIAQEVEKTNPELVKTRMVQMHPEDKKKTEIKVVDYSQFSYMLINAVKELYAKWLGHDEQIEQLKLEAAQSRSLASELKSETDQLKSENAEMKVRLERLEKALNSK